MKLLDLLLKLGLLSMSCSETLFLSFEFGPWMNKEQDVCDANGHFHLKRVKSQQDFTDCADDQLKIGPLRYSL